MSIPQRAYVYLAAFVAFAILLQGVYGLATLVLDVPGFGDSSAPTWIAMIIVALPVWLAHELLVRRAAVRHSEETGSTLRKLYIHGAFALAALYASFGCVQVIEYIAGEGTGYEHIGGVIAASGLWYYLWRQENLEGQPSSRAQTVKRWRIYGLSVIFLTAAVAATFWITFGVLSVVYDLLFASSDTLISAQDVQDPFRQAAGWAVTGIIAWAIQWRTVATSDERSVLRQVYLYGFAFIGGASLALWGVTAVIYIIVARLVGADNAEDGAAYVRQFILPAVGLLIGLALLAYHWSIIRRDALRRFSILGGQEGQDQKNLTAGRQTQLSSTFKYIMSAVGLIALAPGLMALLMSILTFVTRDQWITDTGDEAEILAVAITMIIVGAPLWFSFWWRVVRADPRSLVRRIYLYIMLIALGGTWLFALVALLVAVLETILGEASDLVVDAIIVSVSIVIPAAAFFAYHVLILREDFRRAPAQQAPSAPVRRIIPAPPYVIPPKSRLRSE